MTAPTKLDAAQIDDLCYRFDKAKLGVESAQQIFSGVKGELLAAIQAQGYAPANADKTTRLEGTIYIADATTASTVEIDEPAVGELQSELSRLRKPRVFPQLFEQKTKHTLKKDAAGTLKLAIGALKDDVQARLLGIFARCFNVNSKAPAVSVELASALRAKEAAAAEKAEKKAAREAKKAAR
jgi:hypothetical protein